ncbi:transcription antitermination factor NusB [Cryptosporangium sp. NPDC051539]|uniref:transcription antitermination factor NusB n=1 Tax=Cryptosporangium sp. NPDC051539 TaxID=3363962 RepID=UPI0037A69797
MASRDAYANLTLPPLLVERGLTGRDAAFVTELTYGTLRHRGTLDAILAGGSSRPMEEVDLRVLQALRLGAYQLLFTRVPDHAAVAGTVEVARVALTDGPARFVNAVLRRVSERTLDEWLTEVTPDLATDPVAHLAVRYSHPEWVVRAFADALGESVEQLALGDSETARALAADNERPTVDLAARPGRISPDDLAAEVRSDLGRTPRRARPDTAPAALPAAPGPVPADGSASPADASVPAPVADGSAADPASGSAEAPADSSAAPLASDSAVASADGTPGGYAVATAGGPVNASASDPAEGPAVSSAGEPAADPAEHPAEAAAAADEPAARDATLEQGAPPSATPPASDPVPAASDAVPAAAPAASDAVPAAAPAVPAASAAAPAASDGVAAPAASDAAAASDASAPSDEPSGASVPAPAGGPPAATHGGAAPAVSGAAPAVSGAFPAAGGAAPTADDGENDLLGRWSPVAVKLPEGAPGDVKAIADGRAHVQDEGSQLCAWTLATAPLTGTDERWLDLCAGPGGKAGLLGSIAAQRGAHLTAVEITEHRAKLVLDATAGLPVTVLHTDGRDVGKHPELPENGFDRVLVDAPCTGLGALRRRPEARWRRQPGDVPALAKLQRELLLAALEAVRPGGLVAYVTCSPHLAETRVLVADVCRRTNAEPLDVRTVPEARKAKDANPATAGSTASRVSLTSLQLWPHRHGTDAMFLCLLRKPEEPAP